MTTPSEGFFSNQPRPVCGRQPPAQVDAERLEKLARMCEAEIPDEQENSAVEREYLRRGSPHASERRAREYDQRAADWLEIARILRGSGGEQP